MTTNADVRPPVSLCSAQEQKWRNEIDAIETKLGSMTRIQQTDVDVQRQMRVAKVNLQTARHAAMQSKEWVKFWQGQSRLAAAKHRALCKLKLQRVKTKHLVCPNSTEGCGAILSSQRSFDRHLTECVRNPNQSASRHDGKLLTDESSDVSEFLSLKHLATVAVEESQKSGAQKNQKQKFNADQHRVQDCIFTSGSQKKSTTHQQAGKRKRADSNDKKTGLAKKCTTKRRKTRLDPVLRVHGLNGRYWCPKN